MLTYQFQKSSHNLSLFQVGFSIQISSFNMTQAIGITWRKQQYICRYDFIAAKLDEVSNFYFFPVSCGVFPFVPVRNV